MKGTCICHWAVISCCHPKNISKIGIFRSFSMKFFSIVGKNVCWIRLNWSFWANSCFRVNIQISKNQGFTMLQLNFKMLISGYISWFLTKFSTVLGFSRRGIYWAHCRGMKMLIWPWFLEKLGFEAKRIKCQIFTRKTAVYF